MGIKICRPTWFSFFLSNKRKLTVAYNLYLLSFIFFILGEKKGKQLGRRISMPKNADLFYYQSN
jgi:hypothetical protein